LSVTTNCLAYLS